MEIKLRPFQVPNFVIQEAPAGLRQDGFKEAPSYPLRDLSSDELSRMCDEFMVSVFLKAERADPRG